MRPNNDGTFSYPNNIRFSNATSVVSTQTDTTFNPPLASDRSLAFKKPIPDDVTPTVFLDEKVFEVDELAKQSRNRKRKKGIVLILTIFLFAGAVGAVGYILGIGFPNPDEEEAEGEEIIVPEGEFCGGFQLSNDQSIRQVIADNFDASIAQGTRIDYLDVSVPCLPPNAFGNLSTSQANFLSTQATRIQIIRGGLSIVHPDAFKGQAFANIESVDLSSNTLTELPDAFLQDFAALRFLNVGNNPFITLNNDIFGASLDSFFGWIMIGSAQLTEFPEALQFVPSVVQIQLQSSTALSVANAEAFQGLNSLTGLFLQGSNILTLFSEQELATALNIDVNVIS